MQCAAIVRLARGGLDLDAIHLAGPEEKIVGAIDQHADGDAIDQRRIDGCGACDLNAAEAAGRRCSRERRGRFEKFTPFEIRHLTLQRKNR